MPPQKRKSPGASLLAPPTQDVPLPPLPDEPPPLPEGTTEGFPDLPEGASPAIPLDGDVEPSGGPAVDPVTGEKAADLGTTKGGKDPVLQAQLEAAQDKIAHEQRLADLRIARGEIHAPVTVSPGAKPGEVPIEQHKAQQAAYRAHMRKMADRTLISDEELEEALAAPEVDLVVESVGERLAREREGALDRYQAKVEAMPADEPRYIATGRAPRPKVEGYTLAPGDIVPGAAAFVRLESWVNAGIIRKL